MIGDDYKGERQKDDFYKTPPEAVHALLGVEQFNGMIWEPACGDGAISEELIALGHDVVSTDLVNRGYGEAGVDFLLEGMNPLRYCPQNIITNPPFKLAEQFVYQALNFTTSKVAILARITFLEGLRRRQMFESTPLARVWIFSKRPTFTRNGEGTHGGGMLAFAWFVWDHAHEGPPTLGWL